MSGQAAVPVDRLIEAVRTAAARVPAYSALLAEGGLRPESIKTLEDFSRLPLLDKRNTFQRFGLHQLCLDGELGSVGSVMTSSGHSGVFAFGLEPRQGEHARMRQLDDALDTIFGVRSRSTLIVNCLPMGVCVRSECCTVGDTSVRPDMAVSLIDAFSPYYDQVILVGETAFIKHVLELGTRHGIDWEHLLVHAILGEEIVAENGRKYLEGILGTAPGDVQTGLIVSSMGIAELGLNLFAEAPPGLPIIALRRALHENKELRSELLGPDALIAPSIFTYDGERSYVEFVRGQLVITTLDPSRRIPLIRYVSGDVGGFMDLPECAEGVLKSQGIDVDVLRQIPLVSILGRGECITVGDERVFPEQIKEGLYHDPKLARLTTANFRLASGQRGGVLRIQLAPRVGPGAELNELFAEAIARYVACPLEVRCEAYDCFAGGMSLDYERKFDYLDP